MRLSFADKTIVFRQPGTIIEYGAEVPDWSDDAVTRHEIPGCVDYALSGVEQVMGVDVSAGCRQLFLPFTLVDDRPMVRTSTGELVAIAGSWQVERFGKVWEIIGEPGPQESPTGRISNLEILIKRWDGKK